MVKTDYKVALELFYTLSVIWLMYSPFPWEISLLYKKHSNETSRGSGE